MKKTREKTAEREGKKGNWKKTTTMGAGLAFKSP
jgi:hypothetical protein